MSVLPGASVNAGLSVSIVHRAGTGRAREFVMTGARYSAAEMERWNVVNRVWPEDGFDAAVREFAADLATGPTLAHAATKRVIRDFVEGGIERANDHVGQVAGQLFETEDLQQAVRSFLERGPGKATFNGR